jgi:hypothetical protein
MSMGDWVGIIGTLSGWGIAFWQWHDAKKKGGQLVTFLHGLKAAALPQAAIIQINDMLARLDPPKSN